MIDANEMPRTPRLLARGRPAARPAARAIVRHLRARRWAELRAARRPCRPENVAAVLFQRSHGHCHVDRPGRFRQDRSGVFAEMDKDGDGSDLT